MGRRGAQGWIPLPPWGGYRAALRQLWGGRRAAMGQPRAVGRTRARLSTAKGVAAPPSRPRRSQPISARPPSRPTPPPRARPLAPPPPARRMCAAMTSPRLSAPARMGGARLCAGAVCPVGRSVAPFPLYIGRAPGSALAVGRAPPRREELQLWG